MAVDSDQENGDLKTYALSGIQSVEILPEEFIRREDIDLQAHVQRSFGIFVEDEGPVDVIWRFSPDAAWNAGYH